MKTFLISLKSHFFLGFPGNNELEFVYTMAWSQMGNKSLPGNHKRIHVRD